MHRLLAPDERVGGTARPPVGLVCLWHIAAVVVACPRCHVESDVRCVAVFLDLKTLPHTATLCALPTSFLLIPHEKHTYYVVAYPCCHVESDVRCVAVFLDLKTQPHTEIYEAVWQCF